MGRKAKKKKKKKLSWTRKEGLELRKGMAKK